MSHNDPSYSKLTEQQKKLISAYQWAYISVAGDRTKIDRKNTRSEIE